jgi:hypothetical protein
VSAGEVVAKTRAKDILLSDMEKMRTLSPFALQISSISQRICRPEKEPSLVSFHRVSQDGQHIPRHLPFAAERRIDGRCGTLLAVVIVFREGRLDPLDILPGSDQGRMSKRVETNKAREIYLVVFFLVRRNVFLVCSRNAESQQVLVGTKDRKQLARVDEGQVIGDLLEQRHVLHATGASASPSRRRKREEKNADTLKIS